MIYKAEELANRLSQYAKDYKNGKVQDFAQVCKDCEVAANMIKALKKSKHTKKRAAQRLRKKNREKNVRIEMLTKELECIKEAVDVREVVHAKWVMALDDFEDGRGEVETPHCTNCGTGVYRHDALNYCPYCGAKMDKE